MKRTSKKAGAATGRRAPAAMIANPMAEQVGPEFHDDAAVRETVAGVEGDALSAVELDCLIEARGLLMVSAFDGTRMYPAWQFDGAGVLPGLADVLRAMAGQPAWSVGLWLTTAHDGLEGATPRTVLEQGGEVATLVALATETARRWS